ncbi:hypothetical protein F511_41713 [Dorcoceras hygrometricum]|uniref:BUB1 N-terminal domain-containing protein n=1 Tax=Dorcoceras hygrometricum TaxID=472368 RepID=A0A2Z6ZZM0_9LAMI|nr:hypothetical protein F511_41713 [Dorcoceras hygrometricum]
MEKSSVDTGESMGSMLDPESQFLASKVETGHEWELFKENVRPLKRGRNVNLLNQALKSHSHTQIKKSLLHDRRRLIEAIDQYDGDDPLQPWIECIKWVQEAFPPGGDYSGLLVIYEQCVRTFWHEHRNAKPVEKLKAAYKKFISRSMRQMKTKEEDAMGDQFPARSFGTVLAKDARNQSSESSDLFRKKLKIDRFVPKFHPQRAHGSTLSIYKDNSSGPTLSHQAEMSHLDMKQWHSLGHLAERNKENNAIPSKWTSNKIPQKPGQRIGRPAPGPSIEIFVDEGCLGQNKADNESEKSSALHLRPGDVKDFKK